MQRRKIIMSTLITSVMLSGCTIGDNIVNKNNDIDTQTATEIISEVSTQELSSEAITETTPETEQESQQLSESEPEEMMYYTPLTDEIKERITGKSYPATGDNIQISYDDLAYLHVLYYDFDNNIQEGEIICNKEIAEDLLEIFDELYNNQYQIEKIRLVDDYNADDEASMADNNTSCFNYRTIAGTDKISNHSYGKAIDINPLYNPYITTRNGTENISPTNATLYADRTATFDHKIDTEDLCYKLFIQHGFTWGGEWKNSKDYQHFEKK